MFFKLILSEIYYNAEGSPAGRGRGRGGYRRGRARGKFDDMKMVSFFSSSPIKFCFYNLYSGNGTVDYGDRGWANRGRGYGRGGYTRGRGHGFRGHGRGGRYGGQLDYQQDMGGYNSEAPLPVQGRGMSLI